MFGKMAKPRLLLDMRPLLPAPQAEALTEDAAAAAFREVYMGLIDQLPGDPWAKTPAIKEKYGISW